ncbi:anti-repressor SinI family protein [Salipaludibacillus daqingensis]|uniref:anti-repressor SinI family protein n=1 Tax=Salipaludibacillus daqingensis TaxID=3041001 RepID=UPI002475D141|nr:anti-repressor SinI family protein [Salipaludibacillus daqingensis]
MEKMYTTLDKEWEQMMTEARKIGLKPEDVRKFLRQKSAEQHFNVNEASGNVS